MYLALLPKSYPLNRGDILITEGAEVDLRYQGKAANIRVSRVLKPQAEFEGVVQAFENSEIEHGDLKHGDVVRFAYDKIEHIFKWVEADQG